MYKIENGFIHGYNLYAIKDNLKFYKCTWDADAKKWKAPNNPDKLKMYFDKLNEEKSENMKDFWKEACDSCGYQFVKKGTPEYDEVKEEMKRLIQIDKEEEPIYAK